MHGYLGNKNNIGLNLRKRLLSNMSHKQIMELLYLSLGGHNLAMNKAISLSLNGRGKL